MGRSKDCEQQLFIKTALILWLQNTKISSHKNRNLQRPYKNNKEYCDWVASFSLLDHENTCRDNQATRSVTTKGTIGKSITHTCRHKHIQAMVWDQSLQQPALERMPAKKEGQLD